MIKIYSQALQIVAYLENAFAIGYDTPFNSLWTASFSMPADDEKNAECLPLRFVEIFDGDERVDLFRITPTSARRSSDGHTITYECEHVLATLLDDVLFQFHTVGNLGTFTSNVLMYILQRQTNARWQLGTVSFSRQFEYTWENENLLSALYSVPKPFTGEYQWTWDTSVYPWKLNLVAPPAGVQAYIRYGFNLQGVTKVTDPRELCTRLYCLGYGEGVNQLTISEINGGLPYLDADTIGTYGVINRIWVDRRFTHADTLKARGEAMLEELKTPRITYSVEASELYRLTNDPIDRFQTGTLVRVIDEELGVDIVARVINRRRPDVTGAPGDVQLEIANKPSDIAGSIAELADRQRINEVYAQGATNLDSHDFADNCDPEHPAILKFYIPEETVRINKMMLSYDVGAFRAYSKAIEAAPATTSGPSSTTTTASGGATTSGPSSATTTGTSNEWTMDVLGVPGLSSNSGHSHTVVIGGVPYTTSFDGAHSHLIRADHKHDMPHTHSIGPHTHEMDHTHEIPAHTHDIEYGIFEGPTPSVLDIEVDGNSIEGLGTSVQDLDIIPHLSKDGGGKITRGWHEIKITPDSLGRIIANVNLQIFVQSRGGGDY